MGYYTEIITRIRFKQDTPGEVTETLFRLVTGGPITHPPDAHTFFSSARADKILTHASFKRVPASSHVLTFDAISQCFYLVGRSDLKNYDSEIEMFFDWITPYCEPDSVIGWSLSEGAEWPTIYRVNAIGELKCKP